MGLVDDFISEFGGFSESYWFYNDTVEIRFDKKNHEYFLIDDQGDMVPLVSVTSVVHIIDKSMALVPWGCKMMAQKLFKTIPKTVTKSGSEAVIMLYTEFEKLVMEAKGAHKEKLEEAGEVGKAAHDWIEHYINATLSGDNTEVLSQFPFDERAENCATAALSWMSAHNVRWISTEKKIYSRKYRYPGTMDGSAQTDSCGDRKCCPVEYRDRLSLIDWKTSNYLYLEYIFQVSAYDNADREENDNQYDDAWVVRLGKEDGEFDPWHLEREDLDAGLEGFLLCLALGRQVTLVEERQKARKQAIAIIKKAETEKRRVEKLKLECAGAKKYTGSRYPKCATNDGAPCETHLRIWNEKQNAKAVPAVVAVPDAASDRPWARLLSGGAPQPHGVPSHGGDNPPQHHFVSVDNKVVE